MIQHTQRQREDRVTRPRLVILCLLCWGLYFAFHAIGSVFIWAELTFLYMAFLSTLLTLVNWKWMGEEP